MKMIYIIIIAIGFFVFLIGSFLFFAQPQLLSEYDYLDSSEQEQKLKSSSKRIVDLEESIQWRITKTGAEENLDVWIEEVNDTASMVYIDFNDKTKYASELSKNITKDINNIPITKLDDKDGSLKIQETKLNLQNPNSFLITYDSIEEGMSFKIGWDSVVVDASGNSHSTSYESNENICRDSNGHFHVAYKNSALDVHYANSTDGVTWKSKELVDLTSATYVGIVCSPNDNLTIYYEDVGVVNITTSSDGGITWDQTTVLENDIATVSELSGAVDSNNVVHFCMIDSNDDLVYVNSSAPLDDAIEISAQDSNHCDIEIDDDDNIYVVITDTLGDTIDIMSSVDSWVSRTEIAAGLGDVSSLDGWGISVAIDKDEKMYMSSIHDEDLQFCNGTAANWDGVWSCQEVDSSLSLTPDIAVSEYGDIFILYSNNSNDNGDIFRTNSSDGGSSWETRSSITSEMSSGFPSIASSRFSLSNNISDVLYFVYTSNADVYIENFTVNGTTPVPPDTTNPDINITNPQLNNTNTSNNNLDVNYTVSDDTAVDSCWYSNTSGATNSSADTTCANISALTWEDGDWNITIWVNDSSNNINSSGITFTIDTTNPDVNMTYPANNTNSTNTNLDINFTMIDTNLQACWYSNDSGANNISLTCGNNLTGAWLEGENNVTIWANDTVGNTNSTGVTFTIDTTSPYFTGLSNQTIYNNETLNNSVANATDSGIGFDSYYLNDTNNFVINTSGFLANVSGLAIGNYSINITINDTLGNINSSLIFIEVIDSTIIDTTNPDITIHHPSNNTNTTDSDIDVNYTVSDDTAVDSCWWSEDSGVTNNSLADCQTNITGEVWSEGSNTIIVYVNDTSNNENSSSVTFTIDTTAPTFDNLINHTINGNTSLEYDIDATDSGIGLDSFYLNDTSIFNITSTGILRNHTDLTNVTDYWLLVAVNDTLNNTVESEFFVRVRSASISTCGVISQPELTLALINKPYVQLCYKIEFI